MGPIFGLIAVGFGLVAANPWGSEASRQLAQQAAQAHQKRDYASALRFYQQGYTRSIAEHQPLDACKFLQGIGGSHLGQFQFRDALKALIEARRLALELQDYNQLGAVSGNLASLYLQTNDVQAAGETARQAYAYSKRDPKPYYRVQLLYILATVAFRQNRPEEAIAYCEQGIEAADRDGNDFQMSLGRTRLAHALISANRLPEAERVALEVYRYRLLHHDPDLVWCYPLLAEIELMSGHLDEAKQLSQRGIEAAGHDPRGLPMHEFQRIHARVLERRQEYREAHKWYLAALATARRWRLDLLPADSFRNAGESSLASLYEEALSNAAHLYFDLGQKDVIIDAWLEAEDWRAASLRRFLAERNEWQTRVGPEYWEVLAKYRLADSASVRFPTREGAGEVARLQVRLAELESFAGVSSLIEPHTEIFSSVKALTPYRSSLRGSQALISFQLGETVSHRWILGSSGLSWMRLPPRKEVARLATEFREAVRNDSSAAPRLGRSLGHMLFENLSREAEQARSWVLVLDDALFQVPFPALSLSRDNVERYLIEGHSLTALPGAWSLTGKPVRAWKGEFVGVADAVYNSADPRWARAASAGSVRPVPAVMLHSTREQGWEAASSQLPRLAASQEEVQAAANAWFDLPQEPSLKETPGTKESADKRQPVGEEQRSLMLTGMSASVHELNAALALHPSIVHFAAHVIPNPKALDRAYIALSLAPDGAPELLSTSDVAHMRLDDALVVLSGCESANGVAVPGSGLIGLVRAWLMSGAAAVIASLWPIPDDRGVIFETFYRELRKETALPAQSPIQSAAEALRRAQLEMLRTNSWRAQPKYWATYLITARTS